MDEVKMVDGVCQDAWGFREEISIKIYMIWAARDWIWSSRCFEIVTEKAGRKDP
jgi:hypothetical protein